MFDFYDPWIVAHQASLSMGFSRQEYWSGLSFPSPGDLPDPEIEPTSPALADGFFTTEPPGKPAVRCIHIQFPCITEEYSATYYNLLIYSPVNGYLDYALLKFLNPKVIHFSRNKTIFLRYHIL